MQQNENGFFKFVWRIAGAAATCILLGLFAGLSNLQLEDATTPDGTTYRKLIEGVDQLYSVKQIADDKVLVLYQKNRETVSALYSVPSIALLTQTSVRKVSLN